MEKNCKQSTTDSKGKVVEESILYKQQIKDTFIFISSVLEELIANNGEVVRLEKPIVLKRIMQNPETILAVRSSDATFCLHCCFYKHNLTAGPRGALPLNL